MKRLVRLRCEDCGKSMGNLSRDAQGVTLVASTAR